MANPSLIKRFEHTLLGHREHIGIDVAIEGDWIISGGPGLEPTTGWSYFWKKTGGVWATEFHQAFPNPEPYGTNSGFYAKHVALDLNSATAFLVNPETSGKINLYTLLEGTWSYDKTISHSISTRYLGNGGIDVDLDNMVIGNYAHGTTYRGEAAIYTDSGSGWPAFETVRLLNPADQDWLLFGCSVCISGDYIAVGAKGYSGAETAQGVVYIFEKSGGVWPTTPTQTILPPTPTAYEYFGNGVVIDGTTLVISGVDQPGYIYERSGTWGLVQTIAPNHGGTCMNGGQYVQKIPWVQAIQGDQIWCSGRGVDQAGDEIEGGSIYTFEKSGTWPATETHFWQDPTWIQAIDGFPRIAVDGDNMAVGTPAKYTGNNYYYPNGGCVYPFDRTGIFSTPTADPIEVKPIPDYTPPTDVEKKNIFWTCERTAVAPNSYPGVWEYWDGTWTRYVLPNGGEGEVEEIYCIKGSREENIWVAGKDVDGKIYVARRKNQGDWIRFATTAFPNATAVVVSLSVRNDRMVYIDHATGIYYYNGDGFKEAGDHSPGIMMANSQLDRLEGNNDYSIVVYLRNAHQRRNGVPGIFGTWDLGTGYYDEILGPLNMTASYHEIQRNPMYEKYQQYWSNDYKLIIGREGMREIWQRGKYSHMHLEYASPYPVNDAVEQITPYKKADLYNNNLYYLKSKLSGGAEFIRMIDITDEWYQVDIPEITPTGGFHSIDDHHHLGCGTRYIFHIKNQNGTEWESLQPTGADDTQIYSDVWGYRKNLDRTAIVVPDPPVADKIHAWATGWGRDDDTGMVWGTVFEFNGLTWRERSEEFERTHYPDSTFNGGMQAVHAIAPDDIWFAYAGLGSVYNWYPIRTYHYDGTDFTEVMNPYSDGVHWQCYGITGIASDDVYFSVYSSGYSQNRILHWDGVSITVFADNATIGSSAMKILQMSNGDLYCLGSVSYVLTMYVFDKSRGYWFNESLYSYGETLYYHAGVKLQAYDGEVYFATYRRIFKGLYGNWKQLHEDNTINNCGLSVFPNGDVYWFSVAYPNTYCSLIINDDREALNGQSQYLQHYEIDPTPVLGSARQEHLLEALTWLTDKYTGSAMLPVGICDIYRSFSHGSGFTAWLESSPEISHMAFGMGGLATGYDPENQEWIRMNSEAHVESSTTWTNILYFAPNDIWIIGGGIPVWPYDVAIALLSHFDGRKWERVQNFGAGDIETCCIHGINTDSVYMLIRSTSAGWKYINLHYWDGSTCEIVLGISSQGWDDFGVYGDNAATKLYVLPDGSIYLIGRYVHYLPAGSMNWKHGDVSDWQHEDPSGCDWYTGNNWDVDWIMGIAYDGANIWIAKTGQGIWKGTFGSWEKVYSFADGENSWPSDSLLQCVTNGNVFCGANNGRLVKYDATNDEWSSTLISDVDGIKTHHNIHYVENEDVIWSAIKSPGTGTDSLVKINSTTLNVVHKVAYIEEGAAGETWDIPIGFLAVYGIAVAATRIPFVTEKDPAPESIINEKSKRLDFSIRDNYFPVVLSTIIIYVRGELVYSLATGFTKGWQDGSTITANSYNGYDLKIQPAREKYWHSETVKVGVIAANESAGVVRDSWYFYADTFPFKIYKMLARSIQQMEEN